MKKYTTPTLVAYGNVRTLTGAVGPEAVDDFIFIDGVPQDENPPGFEQGSENLCDTESSGNGECDTD